MADDMVAFVQALGLDKPLICGFSDGGQIALEVGMRYPALAKALVVIGAFYKFSEQYCNTIGDRESRSRCGRSGTSTESRAQFSEAMANRACAAGRFRRLADVARPNLDPVVVHWRIQHRI